MKVYKGLNKDLKCRNFQFEIGKQYEEDEAKLCEKGFHACEYPLAVFNYYPPTDSRYCEAELEDVSDKTEPDTKRVGKKIKLISEIGIKGIVDASVKFIFEKVDWKNAKESNTGYCSAATVEGKESIAIATGYKSCAKGKIGCWLVLSEWDEKYTHIIDVQCRKIDGKEIKEDVFYRLVGGEFKETEDENN